MNFIDGVGFLNNFIIGPMVVLLVFVLSNELKYSVKKTAWISAAATVLILLGNLLITFIFGLGSTTRGLVGVLNLLATVALVLILNKLRGGRICFILFTAGVFSCMGGVLGEVVGGEDAFERLCMKLVFISGIIAASGFYMRRPLLEMLDQIEEGWYKMSMIPIPLFVLCLIMLYSGELYHDVEYKMLGSCLCLAIFCIYAAVYYNFTQLRKKYEMRAAYDLLESQLVSLQERAEQLKSGYDKMAIFRHDMRHYMQIQESCLKNGDRKGAEDILKSMASNLSEIAREVRSYTGILIIDSVLSNYARRTEDAGGVFEAVLEPIDSAAMDSLDLAVVLSNGLENAYHACLEIPDCESRIIKIIGRKQYNQYFLEIANMCGDKTGAAKPQENGMPEHGFGMQSIRTFALKHNAYVDYKIENGWFKLRLILCETQEK